METLRKLFPLSFKYADTVTNLIIGILIYLVGGAIGGAIIGILCHIPFLGIIFSLAGSLLSIYCFAGIVIEILVFAKVLKD